MTEHTCVGVQGHFNLYCKHVKEKRLAAVSGCKTSSCKQKLFKLFHLRVSNHHHCSLVKMSTLQHSRARIKFYDFFFSLNPLGL